MLKTKIISFKYQLGLKKNLSSKAYNFKKAQNVGILYNTNLFLTYQVKELIKLLEADHKKVTSIGFHTLDRGNVPPSSIDMEQFNFFGSLKPHDDLDIFLAKQFDLCICIDESNHVAINYLLTRTKAHFKVGISDEEYNKKKFDLIVKCGSANKKFSEIIKYLKIIESK
ncbi:MAG: hypothetical protein RIA69_17590 [Cyclobacteriaceae bacterium]